MTTTSSPLCMSTQASVIAHMLESFFSLSWSRGFCVHVATIRSGDIVVRCLTTIMEKYDPRLRLQQLTHVAPYVGFSSMLLTNWVVSGPTCL